MISRLRASRLLRIGLAALAIAFCAYGLASRWGETRHALAQLSWFSVGGALLCGLAGLFCWMLGWRSLLSGMGSRLSLRAALRIYFVALLGKYVPGGVWALVAQVELAREHHVPRARGASATLLAMATTTATGCAVAAATLPLTSASATSTYWWLLLLAPVFLVALHPRIVAYVLGLVSRLLRRPRLEQLPGVGPMARATGWTLLGWIVQGVQAWLLTAAAGGHGGGVLPLAIGAYALAFTVGFLFVIAPSGVGVREAAFVVALAPVLPSGVALVVALASRVVMTLADVSWAGIAFLLGRRPTPEDPEPVPKAPENAHRA